MEQLPEYDIVVIDEAHHIWRHTEAREVVQSYAGKRRMLLSDVSQGLHDGLDFPPDLISVKLTEVVRCSMRVVSAACKFQLSTAEYTCHHDSQGRARRSTRSSSTLRTQKRYNTSSTRRKR